MRKTQYLAPERIAALLQVEPADIEKWIDHEIFAAVELPDGRRRVLASSFADFLAVYEVGSDPWPIRRGGRRETAMGTHGPHNG